jgi:cobalt transporter subunit CbtB
MNTTDQQSALHTASTEGLFTRIMPAVSAAMLGIIILFGVSLANSETIHTAAHDTRHSAAAPCH